MGPLSTAGAEEREQHCISVVYKKCILLGELFPRQAFSTPVYK